MTSRHAASAAMVTLAAVLGGSSLFSQTPAPRPAFLVTHDPSLSARPLPADFNHDGKIDLVFGRSPLNGGALVIRLGNGDGTFGAEQVVATPAAASPLAAADFDGNGAVDLVVRDERPLRPDAADLRAVWIVPGRGDGTFDAAIPVDGYAPEQFFQSRPLAVVDDFDGDLHQDLAIAADPQALHFYRGGGDFTFGPRVTMTTAGSAMGIAAADFNRDGRPEVAVTSRHGRQVDLFVNRGGFAFGTSTIPLDRAALGVAAADLNGDGHTDLLVTAATEDEDFPGFFHNGQVLVMLGNGDATLQPAVAYATPRGPLAIAVADFNRDGVPDVATGNEPGADEEECGPLWGSVSVLTGSGSGALNPAASFQRSYDPDDVRFDRMIRSVHAALLDGDSHADLVVPGGILLNRAPAANRSPIANAGPDITISNPNQVYVLEAQASDPDNDRLAFHWTDSAGRPFESCLQPFAFSPGPGQHTYTLTVEDGRGGIATDSVTVTDTTTNTAPSLTLHRPGWNNPVPSGAPYLIQWNVFDPDGGQIVDFDISVDRNGQNNFTPIPGCTNLSGSARECLWSDPGPPSNNAALLFHIVDSAGNALNTVVIFQIVDGPRGALPAGWSNADVGAVGAAGAAGFDGRVFTVRGSGADIWNAADEFHWAFANAAGDFEIRARVGHVQNIDRWTKAGLMVRESADPGSRHASIFATPGTEKPVSFQRRDQTGGLSISTAGSIVGPPVWLTLRRTGDAISAFYGTSSGELIPLGTQTLSGLASTVQVGLAVSSHVDGTLATAVFDDVAISAAQAGGLTVLRPSIDELVQANAPFSIRWMPEGDAQFVRFDAFFSRDGGASWAAIPECANVGGDRRSCIWNRPNPVGAGLITVVGTTAGGLSIEDRSDAFQIVPSATGTNGLPPGWSCGDAGAVGVPGSCRYDVDDELWPDIVLSGAGADIWGTADAFNYARLAAYGDFSITARVIGVQNVNRWTKAGIMIRDWNGQGAAPADSRHASFFVTPSTEKGTAFQRRPETGGSSIHTAGPPATAPLWLKLIRSGDTIRAYYRINAFDPWTFLDEQVFSGLPYQLSAMLVVSSHVDGVLAEARFDNVVVDEHEPMQSVEVGASAAGTTVTNGPGITVEGNGADIWGSADAFRFHYTPWRGDGFVIVRVQSLEQTHVWSKAGVMIRETLAPGSRQVMAIASGDRGLAMQSRAETAGLSANNGLAPGNAPVWLLLRRFGSQFSSSWSTDGETWHFLGEVTIPMSVEVFVGLAVTSHAPGTLATAVFDDFSIRPVLR